MKPPKFLVLLKLGSFSFSRKKFLKPSKVSFGLLLLKLVESANHIITSDSIPFDPNAVEICAAADPTLPDLDTNREYCPPDNNDKELLCRLFSIVPMAANTNDLMASAPSLLDTSVYELTVTAVAGNAAGITTVTNEGCKNDQCTHADTTGSALTFEYDSQTTIITATCTCDKTGETADSNAPTDDPFKCKCDDAQENF